MPLVRVKTKYQVTLPTEVREKVGVDIGDLLEAKVKGNTITLTPKSIIDRRLAESFEDFRKGRVYGPFTTAKEVMCSLRANAKKLKVKSRHS